MELKLNIYGQGEEVTKTYTCQSYSIKMRFINEFIKVIDIEKIGRIINISEKEEKEKQETMELITSTIPMLLDSYENIMEMIKDVFPGLTDEELLDTRLHEVVQVLFGIVKFIVKSIGLASTGKN